nr:hypothetical protein [uncultured Pseudomonas sp.]
MWLNFVADVQAIDQIGWSVICLIIAMIGYLGTCYFRKLSPDLSQGVTIFVGCLGLVAALDLMWITYRAAAADLGILANQKQSIMIGGFAMLWVSVSAIFKVYAKPVSPAP